MKEIMQAISKAEAKAALQKEEALARAREIAKNAEKEAAGILSAASEDAKELRESMLRSAQEKADADYDEAIAKSIREAGEYANARLENVSHAVNEIVRRICSGS